MPNRHQRPLPMPRWQCSRVVSLYVLLLVVLAVGCDTGGDINSLEPPPSLQIEVQRASVENLIDLFSDALQHEDIDRLQSLFLPRNSASEARGGTLRTSDAFLDHISMIFLTRTIIDHHRLAPDIQLADDKPRAVFLETETTLDIAETTDSTILQTFTRLYQTTLHLTRSEANGQIQFLIADIEREGPWVEVSTPGQLLSQTQAQVIVAPMALSLQDVRVGVAGSDNGRRLERTGDVFRGRFMASEQIDASALQVQVQPETGPVITFQHPYPLRQLGDGVVHRLSDAASFFAVEATPDGQTVWFGGGARDDKMGTALQVEVSADASAVEGLRIGPPFLLPSTIEDIALDTLHRVHFLLLAQNADGGVVANRVVVLEPNTGQPACPTVNAFAKDYPLLAQDLETDDQRQSPSSRVLSAGDGDIWLFGSSGGVARAQDTFRSGICPEESPVRYPAAGIIQRADTAADFSKGLRTNTVPALASAADGSLWLGTALGLSRLEPDGAFTNFFFPRTLDINLDGVRQLEHFFRAIAAAIFGARPLSTVTVGNLSLTETLEPELVREDLIFSLVEDTHGHIWDGTLGGGIRLIEMQNGMPVETRLLTRANGLGSDIILRLAAGPGGDIWAATPEGVSRVQNGVIDPVITNFSVLDGLGTPVWDVAVSPDGTAWLATSGGAYRIIPGGGGSIAGTVVDVSGESPRPLDGAVVRIEGTPFRALTNANGHFELLNLPPSEPLLPPSQFIPGEHVLRVGAPPAESSDLIPALRRVALSLVDDSPDVILNGGIGLVRQANAISFDPSAGAQLVFPSGAILDVPPGAIRFPDGVEPSIRLTLLPLDHLPVPFPPSQGEAVAAAYLQPDGIQLDQPIWLTLPNSGGLTLDDFANLFLLNEDTSDYQFNFLSDNPLNSDGRSMTVSIGEFSTIVLIAR